MKKKILKINNNKMLKKKLSYKIFDSISIEPTNNSISNITISKVKKSKEKKENNKVRTRLFKNIINKRNLNSSNKNYSTSCLKINKTQVEKKINELRKKLNLNINSPINIQNKKTEQELIYEKKNFPKLGILKRKNNFIPFTKIKTPFCLESRDEFFYKKIFFNYINKQKKQLQEKFKPIDNKLNINYAENIEQYNEKLEKNNLIFLKEGKKIKHKVGENYCEKQTKKMNHSTNFIKCIIDYAYPDMILYKTKIFEETFKKKFFKLPPFVQSDKDLLNKENQLKDYLSQALVIK